jgi:hypothetical protein
LDPKATSARSRESQLTHVRYRRQLDSFGALWKPIANLGHLTWSADANIPFTDFGNAMGDLAARMPDDVGYDVGIEQKSHSSEINGICGHRFDLCYSTI